MGWDYFERQTTMIVIDCNGWRVKELRSSTTRRSMQHLLRVAGVVALFLPWDASAEVVTFADGTRLSVQSYELKGNLVVMRTLNGKLQSVPRSYVDLGATARINGSPKPIALPPQSVPAAPSAPSKEASTTPSPPETASQAPAMTPSPPKKTSSPSAMASPPPAMTSPPPPRTSSPLPETSSP